MSQNDIILDHLQRVGSITQAEAITLYGCYRLSGRIYDLKARGLDVRKIHEAGTNRFGDPVHYARYYLYADQTA